MGNKLILAVAGAGKTSCILDAATPEKRTAIVTYTNENLRSIRERIILKYGKIPSNIYVCSYFSFLYSFCYQPFCSYRLRDNGYGWNLKLPPYQYGPGAKKSNLEHYLSPRRYLYPSRVSKLLIEFDVMPKIHARLSQFFDQLLIDEVQDFAANDFNFILAIAKANIDCLYVGDFYQHTYDTSRDGNVQTNLHKKGVQNFVKQFQGFEIDTSTLSQSYRCSASVCDTVSRVVGIPIGSHRSDATFIEIVDDPKRAMSIFRDNQIVKLFLQEHQKYSCFSNNWGASKGLDKYEDVCVVVNSAIFKAFQTGAQVDLKEPTRNKLYVACTRARGKLVIVPDIFLKAEKSSDKKLTPPKRAAI